MKMTTEHFVNSASTFHYLIAKPVFIYIPVWYLRRFCFIKALTTSQNILKFRFPHPHFRATGFYSRRKQSC